MPDAGEEGASRARFLGKYSRNVVDRNADKSKYRRSAITKLRQIALSMSFQNITDLKYYLERLMNN